MLFTTSTIVLSAPPYGLLLEAELAFLQTMDISSPMVPLVDYEGAYWGCAIASKAFALRVTIHF